MSAQILQAECTFCKGSGKAEKLMERTESGDWVENKMLSHELADAWIAQDQDAPIRWHDCDCPVCSGAGHYELEQFCCKIF